MPNQHSISIWLQYQSHCLDVDKIERWNQSSWGIPIHVWMSTPWHLILSTPREAGEEPHGSPAEGGRGGASRSLPAKGRCGAGGGLPGPHRAPCPWPKHAAAWRSPPASSQPAPLLPQLRRRQRPSAPSLPLQSCSPSSSVAQGGSRQPRPWGRRRTSTSHGEEGGGRPPMGENGDLDRPWRISPAGRRW